MSWMNVTFWVQMFSRNTINNQNGRTCFVRRPIRCFSINLTTLCHDKWPRDLIRFFLGLFAWRSSFTGKAGASVTRAKVSGISSKPTLSQNFVTR